MKTKAQNSLWIAATAAALFLSGAATGADDQKSASKQEASVHCLGINACKGKGECKTAGNGCRGQHSCKGLNACKGRGFVTVASAKECTEKGGTVTK